MPLPEPPLTSDEIAHRVFAVRAELISWFVRHLPEGFAHEAEDLVQEVAVAAAKQAEQFTWQGDEAFRGWLFAIARGRRAEWMEKHTAAKRSIRLRQDLPVTPGGTEPLAAFPAKGETPSGPLRRKERIAKLLAALEVHLNPRSLQLLKLKFLELHSDSAISTLTGLSEVAVRQTVHRALVKMREVLNPSDFHGVGG